MVCPTGLTLVSCSGIRLIYLGDVATLQEKDMFVACSWDWVTLGLFQLESHSSCHGLGGVFFYFISGLTKTQISSLELLLLLM